MAFVPSSSASPCFGLLCALRFLCVLIYAHGLYEEGDCSYFGLVLIPCDEIWWVPFSEVKGRHSICTNIERDTLHQFRSSTCGLKRLAPEVAPGFKSAEKPCQPGLK